MKKEKTDYSILCYVGIVVCAIFILLPPIFRVAFERPPEVVVDTDYQQLSCSTADTGEIVVMSYKGNGSDIGQVKYTFVTDAESFRAKQLKDDMERSYNMTRRMSEDEKQMTYLITAQGTSGVLDQADIMVLAVEVRQDIELQKQYYEQLSFKCQISKL